MKAILASLVISAMFAGSAFAVQSSSISMEASGNRGGKGNMTNTVVDTNIKDSNIITAGPGSETNISTIDNKGNMTNTIIETDITDSNVISTGGGKTNIGTIKNQ